VITPQRTHAFMISEGQRSKTDRSDARLLACFGQQKQPAASPVDAKTARTLKDLVGCRDDLTKTLVMEKNRLAVASAHVRDIHETTIAFLTEQIARIDQRIVELIAADAELTTRAAVLRSVPGIGPVLGAVLLARLPELGTASAARLASLAGVAPHARDSGTRRPPDRGWPPGRLPGALPDGPDGGALQSPDPGALSPAPAAPRPQARRDRLCPADAGDPQCDAAG
jgi:transposase